MIRHCSVALALSFLLMPAAAPAQLPTDAARKTASEDVPAPLAERVRALAERSSLLLREREQPRTIFIGVDLVRRKEDGDREPPPFYRVRHYRYGDDTTITSLVDLETGQVAEQFETRNASVPLTAGELEEARTLAMADRTVAAALADYRQRLTVEPLVVRTSSPADPWFGQRVVRLLFRVGRNYLSSPLVYVNLTKRAVVIEAPHKSGHGDVQ